MPDNPLSLHLTHMHICIHTHSPLKEISKKDIAGTGGNYYQPITIPVCIAALKL